MIRSSVLRSLATRFEDEIPEVEATATVELSPEQQPAVDDAIDIEQTSQAIEEEITEQEETAETEATMRLISNCIKKYGEITPQFYDFLHQAGYLDAIGAIQSSQYSRVTYPAVESITGSTLSGTCMNNVIAGCEAFEKIKEWGKKAWEWIKALWEKIVTFCSRIFSLLFGNKKRVEALGKSIADLKGNYPDVSNVRYSKSALTRDEIISFTNISDKFDGKTIDEVSKLFDSAMIGYKETKRLAGLDSAKEDKIAANRTDAEKAEVGKGLNDLNKIRTILDQTILNPNISGVKKGEAVRFDTKRPEGKETLGDAGFSNIGELATGGEVYNKAIAAANRKNQLDKMTKLAKKLAREADNEGKESLDKFTNNVKNFMTQYRLASGSMQRAVMKYASMEKNVIASYVQAASAVLRAAGKNKEEK